MTNEPQRALATTFDAASPAGTAPRPEAAGPGLSRTWAAALVAAFVAGGVAHALGSMLRVPDVTPPDADALARNLEERRERALRDYLDAEGSELNDPQASTDGGLPLPAGAAALGAASGGGVLRLPSAATAARTRAVSPGRRHRAARSDVNADAGEGHPDYERLYGSATRYAATARAPLHAGPASAGAPTGRTVGRGYTLQARLMNELASQPAYGTAVAALTAPAKLGDVTLPVGTQVHGTVRGSGNNDTRVFVDFQFARLADGQTHALRAIAADPQGREGIPGRKDLSRAAAGSVGLSAVARAGEAAGRALAGSLGTILGAGVEGAAVSTGSKVGRLDRDDYVVLVAKGTPLRIYVQSFTSDGE